MTHEEVTVTDPGARTGPETAGKVGGDGQKSDAVHWDVSPWLRRVGLNSWFFIGAVGALALVVLAVAMTKSLTVPLGLGVFLAIIFVPAVNWLDGKGVNRGLGSVLVLVGLVLIVGGAGFITADALAGQSDNITEQLDGAVSEIQDWAEDLPLPDDLVDKIDQSAHDGASGVLGGLGGQVAGLLSSAAALMAGLVLGAMVMYYILKDGPALAKSRLARNRDPAMREATNRLVDKSVGDVQGYFGGKTALALLNGVSIALGMAVLGVPGAAAIGVVNFIGGYIPYIGAFIGGAFAVLMALGDGGLGLAVAAFAVVMLAQVILENLLQPKLLGSSLNLNPLTILLATTFGGLVAGMLGLVMAAPVLAIGLDTYHELQRIGFFGEDAAAPAADQTDAATEGAS